VKDHPQLRFHLSELETFLVVVEEGSFSRAAERLCISQPSATNRIKRLEGVLNVKLLNRTTRTVEPTEDGKLLSVAAGEALSGLFDILRQLRDRSEASRNRVVIASTPMIAATFMPRIIHSYNERFKDVQVVMRDTSYEVLLKSIEDGSADIGVAALDGHLDKLLFRSLAEEDLVLVVPAKHPLAKVPQVKVEMMLPYRLIFLDRYTSLRDRLAESFTRFGAVLEVTTVATWSTLLGMIDTGSCMTFLPRSMAQSNARATRVIVELADFPAVRSYGSIVARTLVPGTAIQSFREHLHREFEPLVRNASSEAQG
jgi:LysR family transcriptional regulator, carnitine catabolism transcriptional activator